jgi:hypothetical protein
VKLPAGKRPKLDRAAVSGVYESIMRALAKVVTDRRWAAPLSAMALCFGLFLGVAIGPGVSGSAAGPPGQIVAVPVPGPSAEPEPVEEPEEVGGEEFEEEEEPFEEESFEEPFEEEFIPEETVSEEGEPEETPPPAEEAEPEEETEAVALKGTVVRANPAAGSYTLAAPSGELVSVHAPKLPKAGTKLAVEATPLPNNTFSEQGREKAGTAAKASLSGVVTYVDPDPLDPAYTVSGRGSSLLVHADPANLAALPALGAYAKVSVAIEKLPAPAPEAVPPAEAPQPPPPCAPDPALAAPPAPATRLVQAKLEVEAAEPATYVDLAGVVTALCPATGQILISADDMRESGADLTLTVPAKIKTTKLKLGQSLLATAEVGEAAALTLAGLASDEGIKGAEDEKSAQGDLSR